MAPPPTRNPARMPCQCYAYGVFRLLHRARQVPRRPIDRGDPSGLDLDLVRRVAPRVDRALTRYFALEVEGLDRVPAGPALIVGNHNSGAMFLEALAVGARWYTRSDRDAEVWHGLAHDNIIKIPFVGDALHRIGALRAGHEPAAKAFARGRKVVVFPGGNREAFRPFKKRYQVDFAERTGFARLALEHRVPIVPMVFCGGHSGLFILRDNKRLARLLRAEKWLRSDTWPLMFALPWGFVLGPVFHLPLPVGCMTRVLDPIDTTPWQNREDPEAAADLARHVEARMQAELTRLAAERRTKAWPLRR